jgi:PKD repeat protein
MKKVILLFGLSLMSSLCFSDFKITRGPNFGEIYFVGPTFEGIGLYYSTDYGNTAVCIDSVTDFGNISADLKNGNVYYRDFVGNIYLSENYGAYGSWQLRNSGIKQQVNSGRVEGEIFSSFSKHSDDFAQTFINHSCSGYFGSRKDIDLDPINEDIGYVISYQSEVLDTLYLFISTDKFESLQVVKEFNYLWNEAIELTRGTNQGELYLFNHDREILLFSNNYADSWININDFNFGDFYGLGIVGGRADGEVFIKCDYVNMIWENAHTYILYSSDYGVSFEVFHPFSKGQPPLLSNFSAKSLSNKDMNFSDYDSTYFVTGEIPLDVRFCNYTIGEATNYEWDFNNDGIVDSYEQSPVYTYADTGWYSVKLTVFNEIDTNIFIRDNYVYVDLITDINSNYESKPKTYPNPFVDFINISFTTETLKTNGIITIYNNTGVIVRTININTQNVRWDGRSSSGENCPPGIYFLQINNPKSISKILKTI